MNKKLYSFIALGALLFAAACSDNVSPISGSTSIPNMSKSPVLCSVMGVTDSLEALEKGCIWSPEMWGPTTGYRVRTGYDNGTNTSGIWTVGTSPEKAYLDFVWPGNATMEYDSMAFADVIDKCGGSLCGKVLYRGKNSISENDSLTDDHREIFIDFYLAGKNASGKFESVDARDMGGICVSYSGYIYTLQLIPDDSLAALMVMGLTNYEVLLAGWGAESKTGSGARELCYSWDSFQIGIKRGWKWIEGTPYPSDEDVWAHLKGFRFMLGSGDGFADDDYEKEFKIVGISRYNTPRVSTNNLHPVRTDCEPVSVMNSFCECNYTDDRISIIKEHNVMMSFVALKGLFELNNDETSLSDPAKACLDSTAKEFIRIYAEEYPLKEVPCDNPLPLEIMCTDGTTSKSIEFAEVEMELKNKRATIQETDVIADSLITHCLSL